MQWNEARHHVELQTQYDCMIYCKQHATENYKNYIQFIPVTTNGKTKISTSLSGLSNLHRKMPKYANIFKEQKMFHANLL